VSDLAEQLLEALGLIRRQARRRVGRPWPLESLTNAQLELVRVVRREPGISVAAAAGELGVAANTVSTLVGSLVENGTLHREPDAQDRRIARLQLTDKSRVRVDRWRDERVAVLSDVLAGLDDADRTAIEGALPALGRLADQLRTDNT
jgi:DNA-binding MarR family transcriptional regulator